MINYPEKPASPDIFFSLAIKNISENIYRYCPRHCGNGVTQVKVVDFEQSSSPVLAAPTHRLIISIAVTLYLTIVIADVTSSFQNNLKDSSE